MIALNIIPTDFIVASVPDLLFKGFKVGAVTNEYAVVCETFYLTGVVETIQELRAIQSILESLPVKKDLDAAYNRGKYYTIRYTEDKVKGLKPKNIQDNFDVQLTTTECIDNFPGKFMLAYTKNESLSGCFYFSFKFKIVLPFAVMLMKIENLFNKICENANLELLAQEQGFKERGDYILLDKYKRIASRYNIEMIMNDQLLNIKHTGKIYPDGLKTHDTECLKSLLCYRFSQWFNGHNCVVNVRSIYNKDTMVRTDLNWRNGLSMYFKPFPKYVELVSI